MPMPTPEGVPLNPALVANLRGLPTHELVADYGVVSRWAGAPFVDGDLILTDLMQERETEAATSLNPDAEARYTAYRREVVRRAVGYLGLTKEDLFGDGA